MSDIRFRLILSLCMGLLLAAGAPARATTAAGTAITNLSSTTFSDGTNSYTASSNTLTIYVQNAPSLTVTPPTGKNVTPGQQAIDTFTLTNTGNGSGNFQLSADATNGGNATTTLLGYVLNGATSGTCSSAASGACTLATLQTQLAALSPTAANGTITIGVAYQVTSTTYTQTAQYSISPDISYAAGTGISATASSNVTSSAFSDTIWSDARLDVQVTSTPPPNGAASLTWVVKANDGGNYPARDSAAAQNLFGASAAGVAMFIQVPVFNGAALALPATAPTAPTVSGDTVTMYYSTKAVGGVPSGSSDWSTTYSSSATWIAIYLSGGASNLELSSATGSSSGAGNVTGAEVTYTFTTAQPSGNASGMSNSVTLVANSALDGHVWDTGGGLSHPVIAPGIAVGTADSSSQSLTAAESNVTAGNATGGWPGGASNQAGNQAYVVYSLTHGPYANAGATGWYPGATGTPAADTAHDFTAYNVPCTSNSNSGVNGLSCTVSATGAIIVNELANTGNSTDNIKITATAPTGYQVQLYAASSCSGGGSTWPSCTQGSSLTSQSSSGGSVNATVSVASGATYDYEAVYNAASNSATPFTAYTTQVVAAGQSGAGTGSDSNPTFNVLYPGGVVQLTTSVTVGGTGCPAGESPGNALACPGGTLNYGVGYANVVPAAVASNLGTEPAFAYNACYTSAGGLIITDDATANPSGATAANNWSTYSNNIAAAATDTTSNTVITYYPSASTTFSANQTKFTAKIGGASYKLPPGGSGTVSFSVVVK